jgi:hypothetical protein
LVQHDETLLVDDLVELEEQLKVLDDLKIYFLNLDEDEDPSNNQHTLIFEICLEIVDLDDLVDHKEKLKQNKNQLLLILKKHMRFLSLI